MNKIVEGAVSRAIMEWMAWTAVPLLYDDPSGQLDSYGSGALISSGENVLLVTARHNLFLPDQTTPRELTRLAIPLRDRDAPANKEVVNTLSTFDVLRPVDQQDHDIDVALLHFKDADFIARLRRSWNVIDRSMGANASPQGRFVLSGHPSGRVRPTPEGLGGSLNIIHTGRMQQIPQSATQPVHPSYDLFFHYGEEATDPEGNIVKTPAVPGMSGSVVWELRGVDEEIWTPATALAMVGIQVSWMKGNFVRAKSWAYVENILHQNGL